MEEKLTSFEKLEIKLKEIGFDVDSKRDNGYLITHKPKFINGIKWF